MNNLFKISIIIVFLIILAIVLPSCQEKPVLPVVTTSDVTAITHKSVTAGGYVIDDGGAEVTARGVCWSTSGNPTTSNDKTTDDSGIGSFTSNITGLTYGTEYHVRAYATNEAGTAYGEDLSFTTNELEGKWQRADGMGILMTGSNGEFYSFGTGMWKNAYDQSFVKVGDLKFAEISKEGPKEWSCYELWYAAINTTITKVQWSLAKGSITMSEDGTSITTTSTSPGGTTGGGTYFRQDF
jgi:hypothetical protein